MPFVAALASIIFSAAIGAVAVRRWRRAAFWLVSEWIWVALMVAAILAIRPRLMWGAMLMILVWRIPAAVDAYRLTRKAPRLASWGTLFTAWFALMMIAVVFSKGIVRPWLVEGFQMPSKSMYPTLLVGDHFFVDKRHCSPSRGDAVVFRYPLDPSTDYVKRVIGLPGDVVGIADGHVLINGVELSRETTQTVCPKGPDGLTALESQIPCVLWNETVDGHSYQIGTDTVLGERSMNRTVVPPGKVFVLGDNRDYSSDSRVWGPVPIENIKGKVLFIWKGANPGRTDTLVQ